MHSGFIGSPIVSSQNVFNILFLERTLVRNGAEENLLDFSAPEGGTHYAYSSFTVAPNGDYVMAYRSAATANQTNGSSSLRINISTVSNAGRIFMFQKKDEILIETGSNFDPYSTALTTISGTLWLTFERDFTGTPQRRTFYSTSSDNGRTWSSSSMFPATGSLYTSAGGRVVDLGNGVYLKPDYYRNSGENRRTCFVYRSANSGATWNTHSIMAQDANVNGIEYMEPQITRLQNGHLLGLIRVDGSNNSGTIYQVTSSTNGDTWSTPTTVFSGSRWPTLVQSQNGAIIAAVGENGTQYPNLFYSLNNGSSWTRYGRFGAGLLGLGRYLYGGLREVSPNIVGLTWGMEVTGSNDAAVAFAKFRTETSASLPYVYHQERVVETSETGNNGWNFGNNDTVLSGSTSFFLEAWINFRNFDQPGVILRKGNANNNQQSFDLRMNNERLEITVASSPTLFDRYVSAPSVIFRDEWYQLSVLFSGSGGSNGARLRTWIASGSAPIEITNQTGSGFSGTIPNSTTILTSGTSRWTIGCFENGTNGFHGRISEMRLWDNVNVPLALQNITGGLLYNYRLPIHPASSSLGLPTVWLACDGNGNAIDLRNRLTSSTSINNVSFDTYTILGHGWLNISGTFMVDGN